jgi:hypothetical protein
LKADRAFGADDVTAPFYAGQKLRELHFLSDRQHLDHRKTLLIHRKKTHSIHVKPSNVRNQ